jgi:hypothetical protein
MRLLAALMAIGLAGCTMHFRKEGASNADFHRDWTECEVMANQAGYTGGLIRRNFMEECMVGRGWTRE